MYLKNSWYFIVKLITLDSKADVCTQTYTSHLAQRYCIPWKMRIYLHILFLNRTNMLCRTARHKQHDVIPFTNRNIRVTLKDLKLEGDTLYEILYADQLLGDDP